jgi:hypothetical protein
VAAERFRRLIVIASAAKQSSAFASVLERHWNAPQSCAPRDAPGMGTE